MKKLAIITTHPIQYNAPLFKTLTKRGNIDIRVFYTWSQTEAGFFDKDFNKQINWNIPLLEGYNFEFITNTSKNPNSRHFKGIICPDLIAKIESRNPDAILVYGWAFHAHFKVLRHFKNKIPVIFRGDSTLIDETFGIRKTVRNLLLKYIYNFVDYAFYVGTHNKKYFLCAGLKEKQLIFLPYTIDNEHFKDSATKNYNKKALSIRKDFGIKKEDKLVAFIGKFIKKKNPVFVLKAIQKYNFRNNTKIKLFFIGSGKQEGLLKKRANNDKNIIFMPFVNQKEIPAAYRIANVFVLPSKGPYETWGLSVNEALACKRFVLVSNKVGSAVDLIKNNPNGEIFTSGNFNSFEKKLTILLNKNAFLPTIKPHTNTEASIIIEKLIHSL